MNTFNNLHKEAAVSVNDIVKWVSGAAEKGIGLYGAYATSLFGAGLAGGYAAARLRSPTVVSKNSDKILTSEALATEIDVTERKLKDLQRRRAALKDRKTADTQAYDRFV